MIIKSISKDSQITIVGISTIADKDSTAPRVWVDGSKYTYEFYIAGHITDDKDLTFGALATAQVQTFSDIESTQVTMTTSVTVIGIRGITDINDGSELENENSSSARNRARLNELLHDQIRDPKVQEKITIALVARHLRARGL